jgi:hypothetical protein
VCLNVYPPVIARERLSKHVSTEINAHGTIQELLGAYAVCVLSKESRDLARKDPKSRLIVLARADRPTVTSFTFSFRLLVFEQTVKVKLSP